jgi:AcrR family transcriptional regulator
VKRRTYTRSPDVRREQLLTAAMTLFDEQGADVTVSEITEAAGVSKGTFYVYFESKTELIAQLREVVIADHRLQMEKAIAENSPFGLNSDVSPEAVGVAIDFLSSELNSILFPTAADQARGQGEFIRGYEQFLIDTNRKGITNIPDPYWFSVLLVGAANFAVAFSRDEKTFDRDALVAAIVELQHRALEI